MSATSQDAFPDNPAARRRLDLAAQEAAEAREFTEDLAEEATSELDAAPGHALSVHSQAPPRPAAEAAQVLVPEPPAVGRVLRQRYRLEDQLGNGGTALVYRAVDLRREAGPGDDGRRVAIKLLRPELRERPQAVARLQREFRQTQAVAHPNVVRMFDLDCDGGSWFIVMELLTGETLSAKLRQRAPAGLAASEAMRIALAAGEALAHAHASGVIHGDVKPANIFLAGAGEVRLLDFGVAPESSVHSGDGTPPGGSFVPAATRIYASPDVLAGEMPDARDDVFSLACVIYEMLAGYHPYGRRPANASRESEIALQPLAALDPERRAALRSALAWSRSGRPSMAELVRALRRDHIETPIAPPAPVIAVTPAAIAARLAAESPAAVPVLAVAAAVPAVPAGPTKLRVTLLSAVAAGLALVLGILIGRFDSGTPQPVAPASPPAASIAAVAAPTVQEGNVALAAAVAAAPVATVTEDAAPEAAGAEGTSGLVFFDAPKMIVSKRAVVAALPLRHLNHARRAVRVNWRIVDGTALAGRDYAGPSSGIETFVEGHSFRILYVPIVANPGATRDRTFTVELTDVTPGASFGPTPSVEVTILGGP